MVKECLHNPPDYVKEKILLFFMRTSIPRILKEEASIKEKAGVDTDECS